MSEQKPPEDPDSISQGNTKKSEEDSLDLTQSLNETGDESSSADNDQEIPSFMDKVSAFFKNQMFSLNYARFKATSNLKKKKQLLEKNQQLMQENPLISSLDRDAQIQEDFEEIEFQYQERKENLTQEIDQAKQHYKESAFQLGCRLANQANKNITKFGIDELKASSEEILHYFKTSIKVEHLLSRFQFETVEDLPNDNEFNRLYLRLQKINSKYFQVAEPTKSADSEESSEETTSTSLKLHPSLIKYYQTQENLFNLKFEQTKQEKPDPSFFEKIAYFGTNLYENSQMYINNLQFQRLMVMGRNQSNLPRAWESLQIANHMIEDPYQLIFLDYKREWNRLENEIKILIASLNEKVQDTIEKSLELMNNFAYENAVQILQDTKEHIMGYRMLVLKNQLEEQLEIIRFNEQLHNHYLNSESLFNANDFLNAQKSLTDLHQQIDNYDESLVAESLLKKISSLDSKVNKEYQKGLENLKKELKQVKKDLIKTLNFEKARKKLQKLRETAENQEYTEYLDLHKEYLAEFIENVRISDHLEQIQIEIKHQSFGVGRNIYSTVEELLQKNAEIIYPKLKENVANIEEKLQTAIQKENNSIINRIENINTIVDEELDIPQAETELAELIKRINETGLVEHKEELEKITEKIQSNKTIHESLLEVQLIFKDGDLNDAYRKIEQILKNVSKNMKSKQVYYSETLKNHILSLQQQINASLQDGVESLQADFDDVQEKIKNTLNLQPIQSLLANYKIRAIRLGLDDIKTEIENSLMEVIENTAVLEEKRQLNQKYENQEELAKTLHEITVFGNRVESQENLLLHVKKDIQAFLKKVDKEATDRESQLENRLKKIISSEINQLKFDSAETSLQELLSTAKSLGITGVVTKVEGHLGICSSHKGLLANVIDVEDLIEQENIMEARQNIAAIITSMHDYKGVIIDPMRKKVDQVKNKVEQFRNKELKSIKATIDEYVGKIENKQARSIYASLLEYYNRAKYLQEDALISEIEGCIQLSKLQLDEKFLSQFEEAESGKVKSEEPKTVIKTYTMEEMVSETAGSEQTAVFTINRSDYNFLQEVEKTPEFDNLAKKREYKRKKNLIKRTKRIRPPETKENLNDSLRSSVTRLRLQVYDQQVNRPVKNKALNKCPHCNADQPETHAQFCFFCGKSMIS